MDALAGGVSPQIISFMLIISRRLCADKLPLRVRVKLRRTFAPHTAFRRARHFRAPLRGEVSLEGQGDLFPNSIASLIAISSASLVSAPALLL